MKKGIFIFILLLLAPLTFFGCEKEEDGYVEQVEAYLEENFPDTALQFGLLEVNDETYIYKVVSPDDPDVVFSVYVDEDEFIWDNYHQIVETGYSVFIRLGQEYAEEIHGNIAEIFGDKLKSLNIYATFKDSDESNVIEKNTPFEKTLPMDAFIHIGARYPSLDLQEVADDMNAAYNYLTENGYPFEEIFCNYSNGENMLIIEISARAFGENLYQKLQNAFDNLENNTLAEIYISK